MKNKIGWCNATWNPVWGCLNHCEYCYARKINKRFWAKMLEIERDYHFKNHQSWAWTGDQLRGLHDFKPTFLESQFNKKFPQKTLKIFVGSMSEIAHWDTRWVEMVLGRILCYPQHAFQFLTRHPEVYLNYNFSKNCWLGVTIADTKDFNYLEYQKFKISNPDNLKFICFEPLLNEISIDLEGIDWVIIGAETGNKKGKVIPNGSWVFNILDFCNRTNTPLYIKDNLVKYYSEYGGYKQFPKERE